MRYLKSLLFLMYLAIFLFANSIYAQDPIIDSLTKLPYKTLSTKVYENIKDSIQTFSYAKAYLIKGKKANDTLRISNGYQFCADLLGDSIGLKYADSLIKFVGNKNLHQYHLAGYFIKGNIYYDLRNFQKASDNYLIAKKINDSENVDQDLNTDIEYRIGLIKSRLGHYEEALTIFKKTAARYKELQEEEYYISSIFAIGDTYLNLRNIDSSSYYNNYGYERSLANNDKEYLYSFELNQGADLFYKKDYEGSLSKFLKALPEIIAFDDKPNIAMGYYYIGRNYIALNKNEKGIDNLLKVDSMYVNTDDLHPELRDAYEILINEYRSKREFKKELKYVNRLLEIDQLLSDNYKYLSQKLKKVIENILLYLSLIHI